MATLILLKILPFILPDTFIHGLEFGGWHMEIVTFVGNNLNNELEIRDGKGGEEEAMAEEVNVGQPWGKCEG